MACGLALKRPHEYEAYLSEESYETEAKRARTSAHCSPFRPQMGTMAASLPSTSLYKKDEENSPFALVAGKHQLSSSQLDAYLRSEIRTLRRRKLIPRRALNAHVGGDEAEHLSATHNYRTPKSPTQSGSDSEGESGGMHSPKPSAARDEPSGLFDKPQFSLKQVQMICERLLREQEMRLRYEYETALNQRLNEQHEQYVQFAQEQLTRAAEQTSSDIALSYLS